jgi:hypothetical protein
VHITAKIISGEDRTGTYPKNAGNTSISVQVAAKSGAVADAVALAVDLSRIIAAWPMISSPIRRAILALLDCER